MATSGFDESRVIGLVLARGGSKGIPRKNLRLLAGAPLIGRAVETLRDAEGIARVVVSTDDRDIASVAMAHGADVPFMRPEALATDDSPAIAAVEHAVRQLIDGGEMAATVLLMQATSPCCRSDHVEQALRLFRAAKGDYLRSVTEVNEHPHWMGALEGGRLSFLHPADQRATRRQDLPTLYRLNGAISILRTEKILAGNGDEGDPVAYVMDAESSVDIDTMEDWNRAEALLV